MLRHFAAASGIGTRWPYVTPEAVERFFARVTKARTAQPHTQAATANDSELTEAGLR